MNIYIKRIILILLYSFISLSFTGCLTKQNNGKYASKYSFHPYYDLYPSKMSGSKKHYSSKKKTSRKSFTKSHKVAYNDEEHYPSNMPSDNY